MFQSMDGFDVEVFLDHGCGDAFLESTHENSLGKLFLFLILLGGVAHSSHVLRHEHHGR